MRVAIIGAGPAGMTASYQLARAGLPVDVFEAGPRVGGLAHTLELWGQRVDLGPHRFFSNDGRVNRLWLDVVGRDYAIVERLTRVYYNRRLFRYPLDPWDILANLGAIEVTRCAASYLREQIRPSAPRDSTFESWVVARFGRRLFEIFFKTFSEKLWGISCQDLDADFAAQRIKKLSLWEALKNSLHLSRTVHKTLVDRFAYPLGGTGSVYEKMRERVEASGGKVHLGTPVRRLLKHEDRVLGLELATGERLTFDHIVSSMPLTLLVEGLEGVPEPVKDAAARLTFRNTLLIYLRVEATSLFPDQWIYIHTPELRTGRITNFRNWVPRLYGEATTSILAMEYWCNDDDPIWSEADDTLTVRARSELATTGLLGGASVTGNHVVRIRQCYPIYRRGYKECLAPIIAYLRAVSNLTVIGRYGAFKYNNQDHSILMGLLAAENVVAGEDHDLWGINTDYESYQEATLITETGLAPMG